MDFYWSKAGAIFDIDMPLKPVSPAVTIGVVVGAYVLPSGLRALNVLFGNYCPKQCCCISLWCNGPFCWLLSAFLLSDWAFGGSFKLTNDRIGKHRCVCFTNLSAQWVMAAGHRHIWPVFSVLLLLLYDVRWPWVPRKAPLKKLSIDGVWQWHKSDCSWQTWNTKK